LSGGSDRKAAGIEALPIIIDMDAHEVTPQLDVHAHHAIGIFAVPVSNRIAEASARRCGD